MLYCCIWNIEDIDNTNKIIVDNDYYDDYKRIPTIEEIKNKVEVNWLETKLWVKL